MAFLIIDKDSKEQMRSDMHEHMRNRYRGGYRYSTGTHMRGDSYDNYREGYRHGYEDGAEDENEESYRRSRDSRGRFI